MEFISKSHVGKRRYHRTFSAEYILKDPTVEFAVLETARGGILRAGLGFSRCDIAIITNIREDHLGLSDIDTLDDLARVKSVVVRSVKKDGWAILNAEDEQCLKIANDLIAILPILRWMRKILSCKKLAKKEKLLPFMKMDSLPSKKAIGKLELKKHSYSIDFRRKS
jgi:cyanophycin synthetase